ncbi:MAG: BRO family protein [Trichodesmium sp. St18_bin1]|nr:BRO family protein [Trichodesmium sp. St18_bin1]
MENNQTFHFQGKEIQIKVIDNNPWFLASDIAKALSVKNVSMMVENANVKETHTRIILNYTLGGEQKMLFVDEAGMYKILMKSRKAVAEEFQDWVSEQVLPSIRKTGSYSVNQNNALPADYEIQLMKAKTALIQAQQSFYKDIVDSAITFEDKGNLKLAAIIRTKISNSVLIETKDTEANTNLLTSVEDKLIDVPESAVEASIRLGYKVPHNYESALGKVVKKKCGDLLIGKSSRYSTANDIKLEINVYPPNNKRVQDAVIEYCESKNFPKQTSLSIVK